MIVEIGSEAAKFLFWKYINGIYLAVWEGDMGDRVTNRQGIIRLYIQVNHWSLEFCPAQIIFTFYSLHKDHTKFFRKLFLFGSWIDKRHNQACWCYNNCFLVLIVDN
jgi:hypothetical protein